MAFCKFDFVLHTISSILRKGSRVSPDTASYHDGAYVAYLNELFRAFKIFDIAASNYWDINFACDFFGAGKIGFAFIELRCVPSVNA